MTQATRDDLIRYLALPLEGRMPIFAYHSMSGDFPVDDELSFGASMRDLYIEVCGEPTADPMSGRWVQCPSCLRWSVDSSSQ